jgi:uncharacterized protein
MPKIDLPETFIKTGFCSPDAPIAATLTDAFIDFSASNGLDLRKGGLEQGQKLCVEATKWQAAAGTLEDKVPR